MLIPHLPSAEVFPNVTTVVLHLVDLEGNKEEMQELKTDVEDLALSMLHQVHLFHRVLIVPPNDTDHLTKTNSGDRSHRPGAGFPGGGRHPPAGRSRRSNRSGERRGKDAASERNVRALQNVRAAHRRTSQQTGEGDGVWRVVRQPKVFAACGERALHP